MDKRGRRWKAIRIRMEGGGGEMEEVGGGGKEVFWRRHGGWGEG